MSPPYASIPVIVQKLFDKPLMTAIATGFVEKDTDPWESTVWCSSGPLNWDEFYYRPSKQYGERSGGWVEPMSDWAYFHE